MEYMTKEEWKQYTDEERLQHYLQHDVELKKSTSTTLGGLASPGPDLYQAVCGGVIVSAWDTDPKACLQQASKIIAAQIGQLKIKIEHYEKI